MEQSASGRKSLMLRTAVLTKIPSERKQVQTLSTRDLFDLALKITGHPVRWHLHGPKGSWTGQLISLRHGMSEAQTRSTLAHEIAHAARRDPPGHYHSHELRADRAAAHLLITPDAYAEAERMFGTDIDRIAAELGITTHLAIVWRDTHERTSS